VVSLELFTSRLSLLPLQEEIREKLLLRDAYLEQVDHSSDNFLSTYSTCSSSSARISPHHPHYLSDLTSSIRYGCIPSKLFEVSFLVLLVLLSDGVSALFTVIACWSLGSSVEMLSESFKFIYPISGSIFGMGMFAFSPLIWQYAVTAEVFPLNTLFASLLVYLTVKFTKYRSGKISLLGSFICGLALCNQHTIILFEFPLILWMLWLQRRKFFQEPRQLLLHIIAFSIGFSIYFYLPLAETLNPQAGSWGHVSTFSGFAHHFLRKDYGTFQLFSGNRGRKTDGFIERNISYIVDLWSTQGYYHSLIFALLGMLKTLERGLFHIQLLRAKKKEKKSKLPDRQKKSMEVDEASHALWEFDNVAIVILGTYLFYFCVFHSLSNLPLDDPLLYGIHQRFWMQVFIISFFLSHFS
jgi:hypothetical protein